MDRAAAPSHAPAPADEDSLLDELYAQILDELEHGGAPDPSTLCAGRPDLAPRIEHLIRVARGVCPVLDQPPPVLPGYDVVSRIGAGGMGEVYLARQLGMGGRLVAIKVLSESIASSARRLEILRSEALALARLRHPGVVDVYEFIEGRDARPATGSRAAPIHAFAMQWIEGPSLAELLARVAHAGSNRARALAEALPGAPIGERDPIRFFCRLIAGVARTLHAVHEAGLLHRDIKPSNILLRPDGSPLLGDFGLACEPGGEAGGPGAIAQGSRGFSGTRAYAPPEQVRGEALTARSDVFALGVTLGQCVSPGGTPAPGPSPPLDAIPRDLSAIIRKAAAADPADRYESALALADDLERHLAHRPVRARPSGPGRRALMFLRRHQRGAVWSLGGALIAMVLAALFIVSVYMAPRRAEAHLTRARLALLSPGHANVLWNVEWFGLPGSSQSGQFRLEPEAQERAIAAYRAALWWRPWGPWARALRAELAVVQQAAPPPGDDRLAGLAAYVSGDSTVAIEHWRKLAAREDPDAFIDAALGVLFLIRDEHALAYPRLEHARLAFPDAGFLAVYHADAAVGCGDLDRAERLLDEAERMDNQDTLGAPERVRSDLLLARGDLERALERYRSTANPGPMVQVRIARAIAAGGEFDDAATTLGQVIAQGRAPARARAELAGYVASWWAGLDASARLAALRDAMTLAPNDPRSLAFRLRAVEPDEATQREAAIGGCPLLSCLAADWAALRRENSHASSERAVLVELARRLEISNMARWNQIAWYSTALKNLQLLAWMSPAPRSGSRLIEHWQRGISAAAVLGAIGFVNSPVRADPPTETLPGFATTVYSDGLVDGPIGLAFGPDGSLYVGRNSPLETPSGIYRVPPGGGAASTFGSPVMSDPDAVGVDTLGVITGIPGAVLVGGISSDANSAKIWVVRPDGTVFLRFGPTSVFQNPGIFRFDASGRFIFTDTNAAAAATGGRLMSSTGGAPQVLFSNTAGPYGLALRSDGAIFTHSTDGVIRRHDTNGLVTNAALVTNTGANTPLALGPGGVWGTELYFVLRSTGQLMRVSDAGVVTPVGTGFGALYQDMVFGPDGALYLSDFTNLRVLRVAFTCQSPAGAGPAPLFTSAGKPAAFSAGAPSGTPPFTYQWRKDGVNLADGGAVFGSALPVLTILSASAADAGAYDVIITNACGSVTSDPADLRVICPADFNGDGFVDPDDLSDYIGVFFGDGC